MKQQCLFNEEINIPGLTYISNYISSDYEEKLLKLIDTQEWNLDLKRKLSIMAINMIIQQDIWMNPIILVKYLIGSMSCVINYT